MTTEFSPAAAYMYAAASILKELYGAAKDILLLCVGIASGESKTVCAGEIEKAALPLSFCVNTHGF